MENIGDDCWNIINDYKYQLEHVDRFKNSLDVIKNKIFKVEAGERSRYELSTDRTGLRWIEGPKTFEDKLYDTHYECHLCVDKNNKYTIQKYGDI